MNYLSLGLGLEELPKPEAGTMKLPDGYVYPSDREYPTSTDMIAASNNQLLSGEDFKVGFPYPYNPDKILAEVSIEDALIHGFTLHSNGYRRVKSVLLNDEEQQKREIADILLSDMDGSIEQLRVAILGGAVIGPVLEIGKGKRTKYSPGLALWYSSDQIAAIGLPNWAPPEGRHYDKPPTT